VQGQRPNKFSVLKTLEEIRVLADKERIAIARRAAEAKSGSASSAGTSAAKRRSSDNTPLGKKPRVDTETVDLSGVDSLQKGRVDGLDLAFIMWGHSQKIQVAGVASSADGI
jgi:hypothetical protein